MKVPHWQRTGLVVHSTLDPHKRLVLLVLTHRVNDDGQCWPSLSTLMQETGMSKTSLTRCLRQLEDMEILRRIRRTEPEKGHYTSTLYIVRYDRIPQSDRTPFKDRGGSTTEEQGVVPQRNKGSTTEEQRTNPINYPSERLIELRARDVEKLDSESEQIGGAHAPLTGKVSGHPRSELESLKPLLASLGFGQEEAEKLLVTHGEKSCADAIKVYQEAAKTKPIERPRGYFITLIKNGASPSESGVVTSYPAADEAWFEAGRSIGMFVAITGYGDSRTVYTSLEWGEKCLSVNEARNLYEAHISGHALSA